METTPSTTKTESILAFGMTEMPQRAVKTGSLRDLKSQYPPIMKNRVEARHRVRSISPGGSCSPYKRVYTLRRFFLSRSLFRCHGDPRKAERGVSKKSSSASWSSCSFSS